MDEKKMFNNELDPEIIKVRDQIINKIGDKPLDEVSVIIKKLLSEQMDEVTRLGALAARLHIIRSKIELLYERKVEIKPEPKKKVVNEDKKEEKPSESKNEEKWVRIKMLEAADVNGKQIDKGVILDVKEDDSKKLIESKKAEIVEEEAEGAAPIENTKKDEIKESGVEKKAEATEAKDDEKKAEATEAKDDEKKAEATEAKESEEEKKEEAVEAKGEEKEKETKPDGVNTKEGFLKSEEELLRIHEEREKQKKLEAEKSESKDSDEKVSTDSSEEKK